MLVEKEKISESLKIQNNNGWEKHLLRFQWMAGGLAAVSVIEFFAIFTVHMQDQTVTLPTIYQSPTWLEFLYIFLFIAMFFLALAAMITRSFNETEARDTVDMRTRYLAICLAIGLVAFGASLLILALIISHRLGILLGILLLVTIGIYIRIEYVASKENR